MEIFELKYFVGVAKLENIHKASVELGVSPGSLSKAIARLEAELQVKLFERAGRNIKLTDHGHILKLRASQIILLEEAAKFEMAGRDGRISVIIAGPEVLIAKFGIELSQKIKKRFENTVFEFIACTEDEAMNKVKNREAHFAVITQDSTSDFKSVTLREASFLTVAASKHELANFQKKHGSVAVEKVLPFDFASPNKALLGVVGNKQSLDGWRDDKFQRKIGYLSSSLKLIEEMVSSGEALAYLPDYLAHPYLQAKQWSILNVTGCPYSCKQKIKVIVKGPIEVGWIKQIMDD
jgi:DNA-binding transcriptional LysR family regulator